jgi:hypothetical protein
LRKKRKQKERETGGGGRKRNVITCECAEGPAWTASLEFFMDFIHQRDVDRSQGFTIYQRDVDRSGVYVQFIKRMYVDSSGVYNLSMVCRQIRGLQLDKGMKTDQGFKTPES